MKHFSLPSCIKVQCWLYKQHALVLKPLKLMLLQEASTSNSFIWCMSWPVRACMATLFYTKKGFSNKFPKEYCARTINSICRLTLLEDFRRSSSSNFRRSFCLFCRRPRRFLKNSSYSK